VAPAGTPSELVDQEMVILKNEDKFSQLEKILKEYAGSVLVFVRTKHGAKKLCQKLAETGNRAAEIHSNRSLVQRREALSGFKNGRFRILVATDIAARGIDVRGIEVVINYDLPDNSEDYVHRIGRTGRAGKTGRAISFALPNQMNDIRNIERLIKQNISTTRLSGDAGQATPEKRSPARHDFQGRKSFRKKPFAGRRQPDRKNGESNARPEKRRDGRHPKPDRKALTDKQRFRSLFLNEI
jgi:ATP-dependent RNA helicase RhlE